MHYQYFFHHIRQQQLDNVQLVELSVDLSLFLSLSFSLSVVVAVEVQLMLVAVVYLQLPLQPSLSFSLSVVVAVEVQLMLVAVVYLQLPLQPPLVKRVNFLSFSSIEPPFAFAVYFLPFFVQLSSVVFIMCLFMFIIGLYPVFSNDFNQYFFSKNCFLSQSNHFLFLQIANLFIPKLVPYLVK